MNNNTTTQVSNCNLEVSSNSSFQGLSQNSEKEDLDLSSLEIKGVSMKLFSGVLESKRRREDRPWVQKNKVLARVEDQFVSFFMRSVGPTTASELKRSTIFSKVKSLIESAYEDQGKQLIFKI